MEQPTLTNITEHLSAFLHNVRFDDLAPEAIAAAKNAVLDFVGVTLVGSREDATRILREACASTGKRGVATMLGTGMSTSLTTAALVNAYAAHALDYDDVHTVVGAHISAATLAASLALAESMHLTGKDLIAAYVAGFEIGCRLGKTNHVGHYLREHGVHPTGFLCHFAAVAAAGKLLNLDLTQTRRSLGIVGGHATGLMKSFGTMCKGQNAGNSAHNGLFAALLAKKGFTGPEDVFDGDGNVFAIYGAQTDAGELLAGLGHDYEITRNTFKVFAFAGWRNPIIEATIALADAHKLAAAEIQSVSVKVCKQVAGLPNYARPITGLQAKFSVQYAVAVALLDRAGYVAQFSDQRVADPILAALCDRVTVEAGDGLELNQVRLAVRTVDGRDLAHFIAIPKGDPRNPLRWDELMTKFRTNALTALPARRVNKLATTIRNLDTLTDVAELTRLCRPSKVS